MKKKILSFALAGSLMLGLTGCGQKSDPNPGSKKGYDEGEQYVSIWVHSIEDTDEGRASDRTDRTDDSLEEVKRKVNI